MMKSLFIAIISFSLLILTWSCHSPETGQQNDEGARQRNTEINGQHNDEDSSQRNTEITGQQKDEGTTQHKPEDVNPRNAEFTQKGIEITKASVKALLGQLTGAMEKGGVRDAVKYCNFMANPLIDSLSQAYQASIRRTTFHARNPGNKPSPKEKDILAFYHTKHNNEEPLAPIVVTYYDGSTVFYAPILVPGPLCLTCHGDPGKTITSQDYDYIRSLYPDDDAIGYKEGDLRGMWSISLDVKD